MLLDFLRYYQLDLMLVLCGVCIIIGFFVAKSRVISPGQKRSLITFELGSAVLLIADRAAYLYRGDPSTVGFWMVRVSNFLVFFLTLVIIYALNKYATEIYMSEGGYTHPPNRLVAARIVLIVGMILVVISQFTGLYYTFDASNTYQRAPGFIVCYLVPIITLLLQLSVFAAHHRDVQSTTVFPLSLFTVLPLIAAVVQVFAYGVSLVNLTIPLAAVLLYVYSINQLNEQADRAQLGVGPHPS